MGSKRTAWFNNLDEAGKDRARAKQREYEAIYRASLKKRVLDGYGSKCACCGLDSSILLCIDHVNGGGKSDYQSFNTYRIMARIIREGFPANYQLLCWNCNSYKHLAGSLSGCPCIKKED